jgi:VWFA-related protein
LSAGGDVIRIFPGFLTLVSIGLAAVGLHSASPRQQPIGSGVTAVVIDAVVRDAKGNPITNLRKGDFQLFEDGVQQNIAFVTAAGESSPEPPKARGAAASKGMAPDTAGATPSLPGLSFIALVFDRLQPEARSAAYQGALAGLDALRETDYVAVYISDLSLSLIQPYTNDREKLRAAVRAAAMTAASPYNREATFDRLDHVDVFGNFLPGDPHPSVPVVASAESEGRPVDARSKPAPDVDYSMVTRNTQSTFEGMLRDQAGYAATNALIAIAGGLGTMPGRKTLIYFAEGLAIPDAVLPAFRNVVTTANRGNVSVYTIDADGLRVHSEQSATSREVRAMGAAGLALTADGSNLSSVGMLERNEDALRKDAHTSLTLLAEQTGGFLIDNTNDLGKGFQQIHADRSFYYLLTYTPKNADFDGRWRNVTVKVAGRQASVRARSGYVAVRTGSNLPVLAYEGPALAALERAILPTEVPIRMTALAFPGANGSSIAIVAATDPAAMRVQPDGKTFRRAFTMLVRVLDDRGTVVRKGSQQYQSTGTAEQLGKAGETVFFRQPTLPPGTYAIEAAVSDDVGVGAGVVRTTVTVPLTGAGGLQVSSLVLVSTAESIAPGRNQAGSALAIGEVFIRPNLGEPIRKSRERPVTFYVVIVPAAGTAPTALVEIARGGQTLARAPVALPAADANGRIAHFAQIPMDTLPAGRYSLRLVVSQGDHQETREAGFDLVDGPL